MQSTSNPVASAPSPATVIVIDDDAQIRQSVSELLAEAGWQVTAFENCRLALTHLCQHPAPAVVLVDLLMPGMNAWELIGQMKRRDNLSGVPVLAMTGMGTQWDSPVPETRMLRKPIDPDRLLALVRDAAAGRLAS